MNNHFHLVIETKKPSLVAGMQWLLGTYTQRFNARHGLRGHLFAGRYKSVLVDGSDALYLRVACDYVHMNPVRAGLVSQGDALESYPWSSYGEYLKRPVKRPCWLRVDRLYGEHGIEHDRAKGRQEFSRRMEQQRKEGNAADEELHGKIRRGWRLGAADFLERLEEQLNGKAKRGVHRNSEVRETMELKGRHLIIEELHQRKITMKSLGGMRKMAKDKGEIARRLRSETTLTLDWIARELHAGTGGTLANTLRQLGRKPK